MPTYDYQCQCPSCAHEFTAMHKISDAAPSCPQCGGAVRKKLSAPAVHGAGSAKSAMQSPPPPCGAGSCCCHPSR
ncbi:MAG: zinc ribbon domain-containing protein [Methylococcaceae bacterium]|nr:MAG: zinc ribbon domain-containing protein [Methylococcaceae bacterium]